MKNDEYRLCKLKYELRRLKKKIGNLQFVNLTKKSGLMLKV